jgi:DNA-binding NarL/FixJ family response regulator
MTIVVVDDHKGFRLIARKLLAEAGFDVVGEAEDGRGGIEEVARLRPDAVLLDVQLPDLDGFQVAQVLSESPIPPDVVMVSNWESQDYGGLTADAPIRGFILKSQLTGDRLKTVLR